MSNTRQPTEREVFQFDLQGFLHLKNIVNENQLSSINNKLDLFREKAKTGDEWIGNVHSKNHFNTGENLQFFNVVEGGDCFEELIDNPNIIEYIKRFGSQDGTHLWMNFANINYKGGHITLHSGGHSKISRTSYTYHDEKIYCGNVVVLMALNDIGPGDGATVVIPGTHKSNIVNPDLGISPDKCEFGKDLLVEAHMKAGDALIFSDAITHGSMPRINEGERRVVVYRYAAFWTRDRLGYRPSDDLVNRLTPERSKIIRPITDIIPGEKWHGKTGLGPKLGTSPQNDHKKNKHG